MSANYYCKLCGESFGNDKENPRIINWCSNCCSDERQINERGYKIVQTLNHKTEERRHK